MESFPEAAEGIRNGPEIEYITLREESLKMLEQRGTLLSIALMLAAGFLGIGWGTGGSVAILLYPPIAALIAAIWMQNELRIRAIQAYIRDVVEPNIPGLGWERYNRQRMMRSRFAGFPLDVLAIGGVFALTQGLAVLLGLFRFNAADPVQLILLLISGIAIVAVFVMTDGLRRASVR